MEQEEILTRAGWTSSQPWRGLLAVVITLSIALIITTVFDMETYMGIFTVWAISMVPLEVVMGLGWGGKYPPTGGLQQPWRGFALLGFMFLLGTLACFAVIKLFGAGVAEPLTNVYIIASVIVTFFAVISFRMWPFQTMSLPAKGFLTLLCSYLIMYVGYRWLFDFSLLSYPTGVNPSPGPVPFYAEGGPEAAFSAIAPTGLFIWETALTFWFWMVVFLFVFVAIDFWPFSRAPKLMKQPLLGVTVFIACGILAYVAFTIGVGAMKIEPMKFMLDGVCFLFGLLMIRIMFESWPGRRFKSPLGGWVNILIGIAIGIIGFYGIHAFCQWHFGAEAMRYPHNWMAIGNVMLALTFPAWAAYAEFFDFWPMPPSHHSGNPE